MDTDLLLSAIAERVGIDSSRLTIGPIMQDPATLRFMRGLYLDGRKIEAQWKPDDSAFTGLSPAADMTELIIEALSTQISEILDQEKAT